MTPATPHFPCIDLLDSPRPHPVIATMTMADWEAEEKTAAPAPVFHHTSLQIWDKIGSRYSQGLARPLFPLRLYVLITGIACAEFLAASLPAPLVQHISVAEIVCVISGLPQVTLTSAALAGLILQRVSPATIEKYPRPWMQDWKCRWPRFSAERNVAFAMVLAALLLALAWEDDCAPGLNGAEFDIAAHVLEFTQRTLLDCIDWNLMRLWRGEDMRIAEGEILKLEKLCKRREIVAANNASTSADGIVFSREEVEMCLGAALMKAVCD